MLSFSLPTTLGLRRSVLIATVAITLIAISQGFAQSPTLGWSDSDALSARKILDSHCVACHGSELAEANLDFRAATGRPMTDQPEIWIRTREMLRSGQMPPRDSEPLPTELRTKLLGLVDHGLKTIALVNAGDPGPVSLRRLSNAEYAYTIQDLTSVSSLNPSAQFPADGAAGEGFTNTGMGQGMSPAMVDKYLDAARSIANHLVLVPEGVRFSQFDSRRDQVNEIVGQIQQIYKQYTVEGGGSAVNFDGAIVMTNQGGRLPLRKYFSALESWELNRNGQSLEQLAIEHHLSAKYLLGLSELLDEPSSESNFLLDQIRTIWRSKAPDRSDNICNWINDWHLKLWKFNVIGHLGRQGGPTSWMEPVVPIFDEQSIQVDLANLTSGRPVVVRLTSKSLTGSGPKPVVVWQDPEVTFADGTPPLTAGELPSLSTSIDHLQHQELSRVDEYLTTLTRPTSINGTLRDSMDQRLLENWGTWLGIGLESTPGITGHLTDTLENIAGHTELLGWGRDGTSTLIVNRGDKPIPFSTLNVPARGVVVHPTPNTAAIIYWRAPLDGTYKANFIVRDQDSQCGNGVENQFQLITANERNTLANQTIENGAEFDSKFSSQEIDALLKNLKMSKGDLLALSISPKNFDHTCDTTEVVMTIEDIQSGEIWDLSSHVIHGVAKGNPWPDDKGREAVWHFCENSTELNPKFLIPADSALDRWIQALRSGEPESTVATLLEQLCQVLRAESTNGLSEPDRILLERCLDWKGPLGWLELAKQKVPTVPAGQGSSETSTRFMEDTEFRIPAELVSGATFSVSAIWDDKRSAPTAAAEPAVSVWDDQGNLISERKDVGLMSSKDSLGRKQIEQQLDVFRQWFPAALCYERIVPVDEVITLTLYHREDQHLQRLMLEPQESQRLGELWRELIFVAQEPLAKEVAFEQIAEFATQDRPDLVLEFKALGEAVRQQAQEFSRELSSAEPQQLASLITFANRAFRRVLSEAETQDMQVLYTRLRESGTSHDESLRLLLVRILASPSFLFKFERQRAINESHPIDSHESVGRLSYFLWSSVPDSRLAELAKQQTVLPSIVVETEVTRMLQDPRVRRLAREFGSQWLHVRDFGENNEKSETMYPEFPEIRQAMATEVELIFEDLFKNDRSILNLLDADESFLNETLAEFYGVPDVSGLEFRRVVGMRRLDRGGILTTGAVLASQSGASRTSPILRGNWVYETLLGEKLPRPPPGVPQLPEMIPPGLTERAIVDRHTTEPNCANCHRLIDPFGFALEQFDTIGRRRDEPRDTHAVLVDQTELNGVQDLKSYLMTTRRNDFVRQFCRKLLGYALGREVILTDEPLLDEIQRRLADQGYRVSEVVKAIVLSRQFREIRGTDHTSEN